MKTIRYIFEFLFIITFFFIFKIIGYKSASNLGEIIGKKIGPFFRSKSKIYENLKSSKIGNSELERKNIIKCMWGNYGRILSEYVFLRQFRNNNLKKFFKINGNEILEKIKINNEKVVFISGHFNNFELMAMEIEKAGVNLCAIYRPLNNPFLNLVMEKIRRNYICKYQIKKGRSGTRNLIDLFKKNFSVALMIDQRVSEGETINLFNYPALTTTIPAQFVKKYDCQIVPVFIERQKDLTFNIKFLNPITFEKSSEISEITQKLNTCLEGMIKTNPNQWIWSHNRWK